MQHAENILFARVTTLTTRSDGGGGEYAIHIRWFSRSHNFTDVLAIRCLFCIYAETRTFMHLCRARLDHFKLPINNC